ncbi:MAG: v-SNARE N-terminal domain-containing protein [Planctomycetota bacterium]|jgi:hypothetical protein
MAELKQMKVPFPAGASIRDVLGQPAVASVRMEQVVAVLVSSRRLSDVMTYLHKPAAKPQAPPQLPGGSIFRGMVFGHMAIYTNRATPTEEAVLVINPAAAPPKPPPSQVRVTTPASTPKKAPVKMVGMPSRRAVPERPAASPPQEPPGAPEGGVHEQPPLHEKIQRWTEIIPSGTRSRRPAYPGGAEESASPGAPGPAAPAPAPAPPAPGDLAAEDRLELAREIDHLINESIGLLESIEEIPQEERSDLASELNMLRMELQKYEPGIVRITEMVMNVSDVVETQAYVARLKECLRGLGLLL